MECLSFMASLVIIIGFTVYWLIIDPEAIFLFETAHYLNTFFILVVSSFFVIQKLGLMAKIVNSAYQRFAT